MIYKYNTDISPEMRNYYKSKETLTKQVEKYYNQNEEQKILQRLETELYKKLDNILEQLFSK